MSNPFPNARGVMHHINVRPDLLTRGTVVPVQKIVHHGIDIAVGIPQKFRDQVCSQLTEFAHVSAASLLEHHPDIVLHEILMFGCKTRRLEMG